MKFFIFIFLLLSSCSKPQKVQIVKLENKSYNFSEVVLPNLLNLTSLKGNNFSFFGSQTYYSYEFNKKIKRFNSFDEMHTNLQKSLKAQTVKLDLEEVGDVYKANTFESLMLVSAYYAFEDIRQKAQTYLGFSSNAFKHLNVGLYPFLFSSKSTPSASLTQDNALYMPNTDSIFLLVAGNLDGLPLNMNIAAFAHEYFHRIFQKEVWESFNWNEFKADKERVSFSDEELRSDKLLSATDEGLADLFAIAYTGDPYFLSLSMMNKSENLQNNKEIRNLDGEFSNIVTYEKLYKSILPKPWNNVCDNSYNFINPKFNHYCLGTLIAKTFYLAASNDIGYLRTNIMPLIHHGLKAIAKSIKNKKNYELAILLNAIAKKANGEVKENLCKAYRQKFLNLIPRIPSC